MQSKPRRDLANEMNRRRAQLRLNWDQVATRAGISIATLRRLRNSDDKVSLDTMIGIDSALEWDPGHVEARLNGTQPPPRSQDDDEFIRKTRELLDYHLAKAAEAQAALDRHEGRDAEAAS